MHWLGNFFLLLNFLALHGINVYKFDTNFLIKIVDEGYLRVELDIPISLLQFCNKVKEDTVYLLLIIFNFQRADR